MTKETMGKTASESDMPKAEIRYGRKITRQHLYRLEASNKFPKRVQMGDRLIAWVESEVDEYLEKRIAERS
jgi:prophage regulatory protein